MGQRGLASIAAAAAFLVLIAAATAQGAVYCVHAAADPCTGEIDVGTGNNLQNALTLAGASAEDDRINVRAGTYTGPFTSPLTGGALTVSGVGDSTILTAPPADGTTVFDFSSLAASRVERVHIDVPLGNTTMQNFGLNIFGPTAEFVSITIPPAPTGPMAGAIVSSGAFRNGSVVGPDPANPTLNLTGIAGGGSDVLIEDSVVQVSRGVSLAGGATLRRINAQGRVGFFLQGESNGAGTFLLEDSLWRTVTPGASFAVGVRSACGNSANSQVTARNLTLVNGIAGGTAADAICNVAARTANLDLISSIAQSNGTSLGAFTSGGIGSTINPSYSNFDPGATLQSGTGAVVNSGPGNVNVAPGFIGATDFHLGAGSPLIDIGDPAGLAAGESATDLDGSARVTKGLASACGPARRDIGAYEAPDTPIPAACIPATGQRAAALKKCKKKKSKKKRKKCRKRAKRLPV